MGCQPVLRRKKATMPTAKRCHAAMRRPEAYATLLGKLLATAIIVTPLVAMSFPELNHRSVNNVAVGGPKAVVDHLSWDLGVIESGEELGHTFIIRNAGQAPLRLARGPKLCACTVTGLPDEPIPPGGQAEVKMGFTASAKKDEAQAGALLEGHPGAHQRSRNPDILLELTATVNRRVSVAPSPLTLAIDSSKPSSPRQRSAETLVYSERWKAFELSAVKPRGRTSSGGSSRRRKKNSRQLKARSGYRVFVTMPPEMAEGRFAEWIDFAAKPAAAKDAAAPEAARSACRLPAGHSRPRCGTAGVLWPENRRGQRPAIGIAATRRAGPRDRADEDQRPAPPAGRRADRGGAGFSAGTACALCRRRKRHRPVPDRGGGSRRRPVVRVSGSASRRYPA